jgi:NAD(P)H-dependent flavin oxidoreductase YrpB (nitropropane dioxygenase family)
MITTRFTSRVGVEYPVALGGMGVGTSPALVAAVSNAGGLGVLGCTNLSRERITADANAIRKQSDRPFGLNFLLAFTEEEAFSVALGVRPPVMSFAWPRREQPLADYFNRAHEIGAVVMHMVSTAADAVRAAEAGADVIVAQGTEAGGHVGQMGTMVLVRQVAKAVPDRPVLAAGGVADGAGLAAALALGADGVLLGTRFLATDEAPLHPALKQIIVDSDGTDTLLTDIPDIIQGRDWPGATNRVRRSRLIEEYIGREWLVRERRAELAARLDQARREGDVEYGVVGAGQVAGLIDDIAPAGDLVRRITTDAEEIIAERLRDLISG